MFIIVLLGLSLASHDPASHHIDSISAIGAIALLLVYLAWLVPYLRTDARPPNGSGEHPTPAPLALTVTVLVIAGTAAAFVSEWFVDGLAPAISILHISPAFAGLVIVAIAGNAVENTAGVVLAWKGRSDLAISVVKNSVAQIAAFLFPLLVLVSFALATRLTFALAPVYVGALTLTALALSQITGDGEAAAFEGWALVALYVILAAVCDLRVTVRARPAARTCR